MSLGKGFGSKGKQHHKNTASETQSHTQWSHRMQQKNHGIVEKQLRPRITSSLLTTHLCLPSTVWQWRAICYYRICQVDLKEDRIFLATYFPLPGCVNLHQNELWKHGADRAAADSSQVSHSEDWIVLVCCGEGFHRCLPSLSYKIVILLITGEFTILWGGHLCRG